MAPTSTSGSRISVNKLPGFEANVDVGGVPLTGPNWMIGLDDIPSISRLAIRRHVLGIDTPWLAERVPAPASDEAIARLAITVNQILERLQDG